MSLVTSEVGSLWHALASVPDHRRAEGKRYPLASLLLIALAARPVWYRALGPTAVSKFNSVEPPRLRIDPYVRWCGRGGVVRYPPIPINS